MSDFISREQLRKDILAYATCMYKPTLLSKARVLEVIDNIPGVEIKEDEDDA